jgi:Recombinase/Resolvase, N terminal domain
MTPMTGLLACLNGVVRSGDGWTARCPAHDDRRNSLSVHHRHGRWLLKCHAGCGWQAIVDALGADAADLFDDEKRGAGSARPSNNRATVQPATALSGTSGPPRPPEELASVQSGPTGLTLDGYATVMRLPTSFVKSCGLSEFTFDHKPAVRIPYFGVGGEELAVRFRIALDGDRFRWKSGTKPCLYGLHRLLEAHKARHVVLVEGESDCHTLWFHEIPALGIPGATNWREERDARYLDGIETIYVVVEPDSGGDAVRKWLSRSTIRHRAKLVSLPAKDPSGLHLEDPDQFTKRWQVACLGAMPWTAIEAQVSAEERSEAWEKCQGLAGHPKILDEFASELSRVGVVGERRAAQLIYLVPSRRPFEAFISALFRASPSGGAPPVRRIRPGARRMILHGWQLIAVFVLAVGVTMVSFVSITQSFNTMSSMGRLTLNVLLSFAQFEREVIGERVRDKIAASKRKGLWVGGPVPLGYRCLDKKLEIVREEAEVVRAIFSWYLDLGSMGALIAELDRQGIRTKINGRRDGRKSGGIRFGVGSLAHLLKNRFYIGEITYRGEMHHGEHEPILTRDLFEAVQAKRVSNAVARHVGLRGSAALLAGCLFDDRGNRMSPTHANKRGVRYRYYVSHAILQNRKAEAGSIARVPAPEIETLVCDSVRRHLAAMDAAEPQTALADRELVQRHVARVIVKPQARERRSRAFRLFRSPGRIAGGGGLASRPGRDPPGRAGPRCLGQRAWRDGRRAGAQICQSPV